MGLYTRVRALLSDATGAPFGTVGNPIVVTGGGGGGGDASAANQVAEQGLIGALTETAPASDTASSGLNGRLQRVAQRLTSLIALVPASLGAKLKTTSLAVTLATDEPLLDRLGEVQASPTANTVLDRLKALLTGIALAAGGNEIGRTNWRHINVAGATLTRPANTTPYTALDSISDNATAASVTALTTNNLSDVNDDPVDLTEVLLDSTDTGVAGMSIRVHLFNSDPTASSGVGGGDNAAWSNKRAGWVGSFSGTMRGFSDGAKGVLVPDEGSVRLTSPASGAKNFWYQIQTLSAFTPSANSTTFTPRFKGYQGRV